MSRKKDPPEDAPAGPFNNPFGALGSKRAELPSAPRAQAALAHSPSEPRGPARAVVRYQRKGHGGKEVTLVEQLELPPAQLEVWLKALKRSLGCGGRVEDGSLVLQGDQRERLPALLKERGVRRVTVG